MVKSPAAFSRGRDQRVYLCGCLVALGLHTEAILHIFVKAGMMDALHYTHAVPTAPDVSTEGGS